jgi:hypothetical protein
VGASNDVLDPPSTYPVIVTSFDNNSRAVLSSANSATYTVQVQTDMTLKNMNILAATNGAIGIECQSNSDNIVIDGCRIYNSGSATHVSGIKIVAANNEFTQISNNVIYQPSSYGVHVALADDDFSIINNVFYGSGGATKGVYMPLSSFNTTTITITNNIFYNLAYGVHTTDADNNIGTVTNNVFHLVTSGQEAYGNTGIISGTKTIKDPLFYSTNILSPNGFKLLPGSPAIGAGTTTVNSAWGSLPSYDAYGSARTQGSAPDAGIYEGTGFSPSATGEFGNAGHSRDR